MVRGMSEKTGETKDGERIAKVLARAGVASRRGAEAMIEAGRVAVDGRSGERRSGSPLIRAAGPQRCSRPGRW